MTFSIGRVKSWKRFTTNIDAEAVLVIIMIDVVVIIVSAKCRMAMLWHYQQRGRRHLGWIGYQSARLLNFESQKRSHSAKTNAPVERMYPLNGASQEFSKNNRKAKFHRQRASATIDECA